MAADPGTDPRMECDASAATTCGNDGSCNGAGACRKHAAGTECLAAGCSSGAVHTASTCNGTGTCIAGTTTSCGAYQCDAAGLACRTTCTADANCNAGFCSATACVASATVNLAGNGDVEYGTTAGWTTNGGALTLQTGVAHTGTYSASATGRTANFNGPAYPIPTGAGSYTISAWAMQNERRHPDRRVAGQPGLRRAGRGGHVPDDRAVRHRPCRQGCLDADQRHREPGDRRGLPA